MQVCSAFLMMSLSTNCQAEVLSPTTYCSAEKSSSVCLVTDYLWYGLLGDNFWHIHHGSASLDCLGLLCTRRCFRVDFPDSGGPIKTDSVTSNDTVLCFLRDSWYADCHSKKTRSRGLCAMTSKGCSSCGESCLAPSVVQTSVH